MSSSIEVLLLIYIMYMVNISLHLVTLLRGVSTHWWYRDLIIWSWFLSPWWSPNLPNLLQWRTSPQQYKYVQSCMFRQVNLQIKCQLAHYLYHHYYQIQGTYYIVRGGVSCIYGMYLLKLYCSSDNEFPSSWYSYYWYKHLCRIIY